jgi:phosphatidate cytidylyltransferase
MKQRVITALILAPLAVLAVLWLPTIVFAVFIALLVLVGAWEWSRLAGIKPRAARSLLLLPHVAILVGLWWLGQPALLVTAWVGAAWWLLALLWLWQRQFAASDTSANRLLKLLAGLLMFVPAWAALVLLHGDPDRGPAWALFGVMLAWAADTFAYFVGRRFGGAKLAPNISPGKTWAGFWGGMAGTLLVASVGAALFGLGLISALQLVALAVVVCLASVLGDLFESLIKRHSGAKDSGRIVPGHGGALDRLDSLVAAMPVFLCGKLWLGL